MPKRIYIYLPWLLAFFGMLAGGNAFAAELAPGTAICFKVVSQAIKIDGEEGDWPRELREFPGIIDSRDQFRIGDNQWAGPNDYSLRFYTAWDETNFYLLAQITDDYVSCSDLSSRDFFNSDYLRIYLSRDPGGAGFGEGDYAFAIVPMGPGGKATFKVVPYGTYDYKDFPLDKVQVASKVSSGGYTLEFSVPWTALGITAVEGKRYGFQIIGGDSDSGVRNHEALWKRTTSANYWENKGSFGQITLVEDKYLGLELERKRIFRGEELRGIVPVGLLAEKKCQELAVLIKKEDEVVLKQRLDINTLSPFNRLPFALAVPLEVGLYQVTASLVFEGGEKLASAPEQLIVAQELVLEQNVSTNLLRLVGASEAPMAPRSGVEDYQTRVWETEKGFCFEYDGEFKLRYELLPRTGTLQDLSVYLNDSLFLTPDPSSGPFVEVEGKNVSIAALSPRLVSSRLEEGKVYLQYRFLVGKQSAQIEYELSLNDKTLVWRAQSKDTCFVSFSGGVKPSENDKQIGIPYYPAAFTTFERDGVWVSAFFDWVGTRASRLEREGPTAVYSPKTDGQRNQLSEVFYLVVSPDLREVFPNIPNRESPYRDLLSRKVIFDYWGGWPFEELAKYLTILKGYGLDDLAVIQHSWQYMGYDNGFPETVPARESLGGDKGMKFLTETARRLGYLYALHENYQDYYPNFSGFTEAAIALGSNGAKLKAWFNPTTGIQSYLCKTDWQRKYAQHYSTEIKKRYGTTMAYHDGKIIAAFPAAWDYDAKAEYPAMLQGMREHGIWLADFLRKTYGGPVLGEGGQHSAWAGIFDGAEAQVEGGQTAPLLVDFDLLKVHPLAVNHGMGYYERWLRGDPWATPSEKQLDDYRAMNIAFGHAGWFGDRVTDFLTYPIREYYLMRPLQERYLLSKPVQILYEDAGELVDLTEAVKRDSALDRVQIEYDNGLKIYVNRRAEDWRVGDIVIPQAGFLAQGAGVFVATAKFGGKIADYAETKERIYADARTYIAKQTEKIWRSAKIKPEIDSLEYLGGRRFRVKYVWLIDQDVYADYKVFVHFRHPASSHPEKVAFANDHEPAMPTALWRKGYLVEEGPFTLEVPAGYGPGEFTVWIGLYRGGEGRFVTQEVGKLICEGTGGTITAIRFEPTPEPHVQPLLPGVNPQGTLIDFGAIATDGAVRIDRSEDSLLLMPIPHGVQIKIRLGEELLGSAKRAQRILALGEKKEALGEVRFAVLDDGSVEFLTSNPQAWYYKVELSK